MSTGAPRKPSELQDGAIVGGWRIGQLLGRGGQGAVWATKPINTRRTPSRALKACFSTDAQSRARFEREITLMKQCDSPLIPKLLASDANWTERVAGAPAFAFYVTEKCEGSLDQRQRDLGDARARLRLFAEACAAVNYLHTLPQPVIHRDIKPANFLLAQEPRRLILADFGIARHELVPSAVTEIHEVVGSRFFRAPEILNGDPGSVRSDVYSLGRVLEWLLTGDISTDLGARPVARGGELADDVCDALDRIIVKATQAIAANRFSSVRELIDNVPSLWFAVRPTPRTEVMHDLLDAEAVRVAATQMARSDDGIGWRELEQQLRRAYPEWMRTWREGNESPAIKDKADLYRLVDQLVQQVLPRLVQPLVGIQSQRPAFRDQRRVIEDVLFIPEWKPSGRTIVVEAPRGLVYLFHHVHGALCCETGQHDLALQVAEATITRSNGQDPEPLWMQHDVSGWPELFGHDCSVAWEYLAGFVDRHNALNTFFALPDDFSVGLASYCMLLSLIEMASRAERLLTVNAVDWKNAITPDLPPMFTMMRREIIERASRRTVGNEAVVELVARRMKVQRTALKQLWPQWKGVLSRFRREAFRNRWFDELQLGEIA